MTTITVRVSQVGKSDRNNSEGILKLRNEKWVIISNASQIFQVPSNWKVEIEITRELDKVRIGKIFRIIEELTEEQVMKKLIAPLEEKFGIIDLPLWGERGIFSHNYHGSILNLALRRGAGYEWWSPTKHLSESDFRPGSFFLDISAAEKIWEKQVSVQKDRLRLLERVAAIWEKFRKSLRACEYIMGRAYLDSFLDHVSKPEINYATIPLLDFHVRFGWTPTEECLKFFRCEDIPLVTFDWTDEGVSAYEEAFCRFVQEKVAATKIEADAFMAKNISLLESGEWILGVHKVYSTWTSYHDGFGSHSEYEMSDSGVKYHQKKGLMLRGKIGVDVSMDNTKYFMKLTEEGYNYLSSLFNSL